MVIGFVFISFLNSQLCSIAACTKETKLNIKSVSKKLNPKVTLTKLSGNNNIFIKQLFTKPKNHVNISNFQLQLLKTGLLSTANDITKVNRTNVYMYKPALCKS